VPRLTAFISDLVQKTGYRANVVILANAFGLQGYVQNLPNGKVKVAAEGEQTDLERFQSCLSIKDALIDVQSIEYEYTAATGDFIGSRRLFPAARPISAWTKSQTCLKISLSSAKRS
jgi:acylphosphatase